MVGGSGLEAPPTVVKQRKVADQREEGVEGSDKHMYVGTSVRRYS